MRIEIWDKTSNLMFPGEVETTPEEIFKSGNFPIDKFSIVVLEYMQGTNTIGGIDNLAILRQVHKIDETLSDDEAFKVYKNIRENPPEPVASNNLRLGTLGDSPQLEMILLGILQSLENINSALLKAGIIESDK